MFNLIEGKIDGIVFVKHDISVDERGASMEICNPELPKLLHSDPFVVDYLASSTQRTLRGLHYPKYKMGKLIRVVHGRVYDVYLDLRKGSPTFGMWETALLWENDSMSLWIPPGFAHGYYVLSKWAEVWYKFTAPVIEELTQTIRWDDKTLSIPWPIDRQLRRPILSEKDKHGDPMESVEAYE